MDQGQDKEQFRDSISTVNKQGKRVWVYPKKPKGRFHTARVIVTWFLLIFMIGSPLIKIKGHPLILLDVLNRKFIFFGLAFGPHDFYLFLLGFISLVVFIILFTAIYGRVFCGWICPQTIFMEMVFRKLEYWIEGDAKQQKQLAAAPWTANKWMKKLSKWMIFYLLSFLVANILLSYLIGVDELYNIITEPVALHTSGFIWINVFTGIFYFIFSFFREQACTIVCPYGRLQGVLLDQNSLVVAYDYVRGEPRGFIKKNSTEAKGDCIACKLCVDVCPTGIDIRDGIQLECVNCTACIDACDTVMDKVKRPRGLIRYDSLNGIAEQKKFSFTPRIISYSAVLLFLLSIFTYLFAARADFSINILRSPGMMYQDLPDDKISNLYELTIVNKSFDTLQLVLKVNNFHAEIKFIGGEPRINPQQVFEARMMVIIPQTELRRINEKLFIDVYQNDKMIKTIKTSFLSHLKIAK